MIGLSLLTLLVGCGNKDEDTSVEEETGVEEESDTAE
jgi:hypothetical protein